MLSNLSGPARQMFWGDLLLVVCCVFYLLWWAVAFKPVGAVKGFRSGWLLVPVFAAGMAAVWCVAQGAIAAGTTRAFFSGAGILAAAVLVYVALLLVTRLAFHRQVTTELLLIVGWAVLVFAEVNALYALGLLAQGAAIGLLAAAVVVAAASLVCYLLYYGLSPRAGYLDGMIPLLLAAIFMAVLAAITARAGS